MDYLYSLANILSLISLSFRKVILIRLFFASSDLVLIEYSLLAHMPQMMYWSLASLTINTVMIILLIKDMFPKNLTKEMREIKKIFFSSMQTSDFLRIMKLSHECESTQEKLLIKDEPVANLILITDGTLYIDFPDTTIELGKYNFIGEMSYFDEGKAHNTVYAKEPVKYRYWQYEDLRKLEHRKPHLFMKMIEAMGKDIVLKMINKNKMQKS